MKITIGSIVQWNSLNGPETGKIERIAEQGIIVRLESGKCIIAHEKSLKKV